MAYTKIFAVRDKMARAVSYAVNPDKIKVEGNTPLQDMVDYALDATKMEERLFESAINCQSPESAYSEMLATKRRFGKQGGILAYHVIQSFKPGEVTPEQAHEIGLEFARRCFGDRFEVVVGTHLDRNHYHNHIVLNSVSCVDGLKYHSDHKSYFKVIRGVSDQLCRENELSVINPTSRGKSYKQWHDEKMGKPSGATLIKGDIDDAIGQSFTFAAFVEQMKKRGYGVKCGPNVTHMAVKPQGGRKFFRLDTFRDPWYTEQGIKERIAAAREGREPEITPKEEVFPPAARKPGQPHKPLGYNMPLSRPWRKPRKLKGFVALYWKYCYLLRETMHRKLPNRAVFLYVGGTCLREEMRKFDRYQRQFLFLYRHKIETVENLRDYRQGKENELAAGIGRRKELYMERKHADEARQAEVSAEISKINEGLRGIRQEIRLCDRIAQDAPRLQSTCEQVDASQAQHQDIGGQDRGHDNGERRI